MNPARKPLILRVTVVIFAVSLVSSYVVFSQTRAKPQVASGTNSKRVLEDLRQTQTADAMKEGAVQLPGGKAATPASGSGRVFSLSGIVGNFVPEIELVNPQENVAVLGTKSGAPLIPPTIQLRIARPTPAPLVTQTTQATQPSQQQTIGANAPNSKVIVPVIPQSAILPQAKPAQPAVRPIAPGSKSLVPIFRMQPPASSAAKQVQSR